ncbi:MAG: PAS domain-containing sensor histidine kinase [Melioribacteraceae bacterium]|nr:PAS domain-containing sensor histidine kinase [Melioribacteraceae bacterium]
MYDYQIETLFLLNQLKQLKAQVDEYKYTIDHLQEANQELLEDSKLLKIITNSSKDLILRHAPDGEILSASPSCINLMGYLPIEIVGKYIYDFIEDETGDFELELQKQLKNNGVKTFRFKMKHKLGEPVWVETKRRVVTGNTDAIYKEVINWISDVSEEMESEEKLKEVFKELHSKKAFLTDLIEHQGHLLLQSKVKENKIEELNLLKDRIISIIAHDLRNPFGNILGITEVIMDEQDLMTKDEIIVLCENVHTSVRKGNALLQDLVNWSASHKTEFKIKNEIINLKDLVDGCFEIYITGVKAKHLQTINEVPDSVEFNTDPNILATVLRNIISNAIKFSKKGGTVTAKLCSSETKHCIEIIDEGIGHDGRRGVHY